MKQAYKMYICVIDEFPDYMTPTLVAHATLRHHLAMNGWNKEYDDWLSDSFKKCVVRVNRKEFEKIRRLPNSIESWENNTLDGDVSCITVIANQDDYNVLKYAKLWNVAK